MSGAQLVVSEKVSVEGAKKLLVPATVKLAVGVAALIVILFEAIEGDRGLSLLTERVTV